MQFWLVLSFPSRKHWLIYLELTKNRTRTSRGGLIVDIFFSAAVFKSSGPKKERKKFFGVEQPIMSFHLHKLLIKTFLPLAKWKPQTLRWHFIFCQSNSLKHWRRVVVLNSLCSSTHAAKSSWKLRVCYLTCRGPGSGGTPLLPLFPLSSCQLPVELLWLSRWQEVLIFDRVLKNSHRGE